MALSPVYYARGDSNSANNAELNVQNQSQFPVTPIQFTSGTSGDLILDFVPDDGDTDVLPEFDPDTQVIIGGLTYNFVFLKSGTLDPSRVPIGLANDPVYVIKVDVNRDGDVNDNGDFQIFFTTSADGTIANMRAIQNGALRIGNLDTTPPPDPVCLCAGTFVLTPSGNRLVESLQAGDHVLNDVGQPRQILWIGHSNLSLAHLIANEQLRPVRISAGAFGSNLPDRDLFVSPQHRVVVEGALADLLFAEARVLVAAKHLVGAFAEQVAPKAGVVYYHVLLEDHELLVTNGLVTESFQPARRIIDAMSAEMQVMLLSVIEALGAEDMLTRKDALPSLNRAEGELFGHLCSKASGADPAPVGRQGGQPALAATAYI
jgi:hypothetical protein